MAKNPGYIKNGMGGSRNGKQRTEYTEILKEYSKKTRRRLDKKITKDELSNLR
tara:strand:- start:125 stop:283 length:159 start_codon:yes stop_codon:yes gene_type:complete